jgi:flagellar basal body-associated protein FliL
MMTFFTIFLVLIGLNAVMMVVSLKSVSKKAKKSTPKVSDEPSVIYSLDLLTSNYKKAV